MSAVSTVIPTVQHSPLHAARPEALQAPSPPVATAHQQPAYIVSVANLPPIQQPRADVGFANFARDLPVGPSYTLAGAIQAALVHEASGVSWSISPGAAEQVTAVASVAASPSPSDIRGSVADAALNARAAAIVARDSVGTVSPQSPAALAIDDPTAPSLNVFT
jgi:hypothetical protein